MEGQALLIFLFLQVLYNALNLVQLALNLVAMYYL